MSIWVPAIGSVIIVSLVSLVGIVFLVTRQSIIKAWLLPLVSFAVGALLGDALIHLLPEATAELGNTLSTSLLVLGGILIFFILEKFIRWRHCHIADTEHHIHPVATINLFGDAVHNFIDGALIGASYMVSFPVGLATTVAVVLHEIPNEISDVAILIHGGLKAKKVIYYNFLSALAAVVGAIVSLIIGPSVAGYAPIVSALTAGGFIYIAGSDLVPSLHTHEEKPQVALGQLAAIVLGIAVMAALTLFE